MVESFRVNAVLNFTSNAPQVLQQLGREFSQFDRVIKDGQANLKAFETTLRGIGSSRNLGGLVRNLEQLGRVRVGNIQGLASLGQASVAIERLNAAGGKGITQLVRGLEQLGKINLGGAPSEIDTLVRLLDNIVNVQNRVLTGAKEIGIAWKETAEAMREGAAALRGIRTTPPTPGGGRGRVATPGVLTPQERQRERDWGGAGMVAGMASQAIRSPIEKAFADAMETQERTALLGIGGFTGPEMSAAKANAYNVQTGIPGATVASSLEITKDLYSVIRDANEAVANTANLAATGVVLGKVGKGDEIAELFKSMQAGELRGALSQPGSEDIDVGKFEKFIRSVEMVSVGTGGRVGPGDYAGFLRQAGVAGVRMSDEAMFQSFPAVMMALKSVRAGTALQSFQQSEFGHLAAGYGTEQERIGLILPGGQHKVGKGGATVISPGGLVNESDAQSNFPHWIFNTLMPKLDKFVDPNNKMNSTDRLNASMRELYNLFPRNTITRMIEDIMRNRPLIEKYERGLDPNSGPMANKDFNKELFANDPKLHLEQFNAAWTAFLSSFGEATMGSVIKILDNLTSSLNAMAAWARANPAMAATIVEVATALGVLAAAVSALSLASIVLGPGGRILKSIGAGAAGLAAGTTGAIAAGAAAGLGIGTYAAHYFPGQHAPGEISRADRLLNWLGMNPAGAPTANGGVSGGGFGPSAAPGAANNNQPGSSASNPVYNIQLNQPSGRDIANGVSANQANSLGAGPRASTGFDSTMQPAFSYLGAP